MYFAQTHLQFRGKAALQHNIVTIFEKCELCTSKLSHEQAGINYLYHKCYESPFHNSDSQRKFGYLKKLYMSSLYETKACHCSAEQVNKSFIKMFFKFSV